MARVRNETLLQIQRRAAHEPVTVSAYVRQALLEKIFRDIDDQKDKDTAKDRS
jgi:hypothetical protein